MNDLLYARAGAQLIMQPSLVSARRILFLLIAPTLKGFFERVRDARIDDEDGFLGHVFNELITVVGSHASPRVWTVQICEAAAPAVISTIAAGEAVTLADMLKEPDDRSARLPCVPLVLRRGEDVQLMPELETRVQSGDELLFCGRERAAHLLDATLANEYTLRYLMTGTEPARGYFMQWLLARKNPEQHNHPAG
jgi:hypothetical protein